MANSRKIDIDERFEPIFVREHINATKVDLLKSAKLQFKIMADHMVRDAEDGRELSLAITKMEEALMWYEQALFKEKIDV